MFKLLQLKESKGMFGKVFKGGAWLALGSTGEHGLRFIRNMILTRVLFPEAFGLMAITLSVTALFQVLTTVGVKEAIVQNPRGGEKTYLNGAWWLAAVRGIVLYCVAFLAAPAIASFYNQPLLTHLIRVAFLSLIFQGCLSPRAYLAIKQMRFGPWVVIQQGGGFLGVASALALALYLRSVWALVLGYVIENAARCILSYILTPFVPGTRFSREDLRALFSFSRGLFGLPALMMIYSEGATMVVGKVCSTEQVGWYAMALALARMPSLIGLTMVDLLMPAFSEIQKYPARINQALLKITSLLALGCAPALTFVFIFGREMLRVVYGPSYSTAAVPFALLFANEVLLTFNVPLAAVFMASGKPALLRRFSLVRAALLAVLIFPATKLLGLTGAAATVLLSMAMALNLQMLGVHKLTGLEFRSLIKPIMRGLPLAVPVLLIAIISKAWNGISPLATLLIAAGATGACFFGLGVATFRSASLKAYFWPFTRGEGSSAS